MNDDSVSTNTPPRGTQAVPEPRRPSTGHLSSLVDDEAYGRARQRYIIKQVKASQRHVFIKGAAWRLGALGVSMAAVVYAMERLLDRVAG